MEEEFIAICEHNPVDYDRLYELLNSGFDINAEYLKQIYDCNLLASIIEHYSKGPGAALYDLVKFFISNGFDVKKYGGECLAHLCWSMDNEWVLKIAELLLDNGADATYEEDDETILDFCEWKWEVWYGGDYDVASIMLAYHQMIKAAIDGRDYHGIRGSEECIGHQIRKIEKLVSETSDNLIRDNVNCFDDIIIWCDDVPLYVVKPPTLYVNPLVTTSCDHKVDISECFSEIIGLTVKSQYFVSEETAILEFENSDVVLLINFAYNYESGRKIGCIEIARPCDSDTIGESINDII